MAERYVRLFSIPEKQYAAGAPLLILAGALLKDNYTGMVLAQFKFKNISDKKIAAVHISVSAFDQAGHKLPNDTAYQYSGLSEQPYAEFGQKQAVPLPDATACAISVTCTRVIFSDGSSWNQTETTFWQQMPGEDFKKLTQEEEAQFRKKHQRRALFCLILCGLGVFLNIIAGRYFVPQELGRCTFNYSLFIPSILYCVIAFSMNWKRKPAKYLPAKYLEYITLAISVLPLLKYSIDLVSSLSLYASWASFFYFRIVLIICYCLYCLSWICIFIANILCIRNLWELNRKRN